MSAAPGGDARPLRGYVICGEPRSGSNLLCQLLASTDLLGRPRDFLNTAGMRGKEDPHYPSDPRAQLSLLLARGCTPNGIYGFKMFTARFDEIAPLDWTGLLPDLRFIHLERRDLLGQAISDWRAQQSGQYRASTPAHRQARYDRARIAARMRAIAIGQARWRCWFARNGIDPLALFYEDVAARPEEAVARVARLMGVEPAPPIDFQRVAVRRQADAITEAWRERIIREVSDRRFLDGGGLVRASRRLRAGARWLWKNVR